MKLNKLVLPSTVCVLLNEGNLFRIVGDEIKFDKDKYFVYSSGKLVAIFGQENVNYLFIESVRDYRY